MWNNSRLTSFVRQFGHGHYLILRVRMNETLPTFRTIKRSLSQLNSLETTSFSLLSTDKALTSVCLHAHSHTSTFLER